MMNLEKHKFFCKEKNIEVIPYGIVLDYFKKTGKETEEKLEEIKSSLLNIKSDMLKVSKEL